MRLEGSSSFGIRVLVFGMPFPVCISLERLAETIKNGEPKLPK